MSRSLIAACIALSSASLALAGYALHENSSLRTELAATRRAQPPRDGRAAADDEGDGGSVEARVSRLESLLASGSTADGGSAAAGTASGDGTAGALSPAAAAPLRALVKDLVREEVDARAAAEAKAGKAAAEPGPKKPPLSQFAAELELAPAQKEGVHLAVLKGQEELISILRTPTESGRVPLIDILGALMGKPEETQPRMIEIFGMLATERMPGSGDTYSVRVEALKKETVEAFRRDFTPEQFKAFEKMGQDPLEIQVPDSPWIGILQEAYRRGK